MNKDKRRLHQALLSVTFHTDGHQPTGKFRPMPLADALQVIFHCDDHPCEHTDWVLQKLTCKPVAKHIEAQALGAISRATMPALARAYRGSDVSRHDARDTACPALADIRDRFQRETPDGTCTFTVGPCTTTLDSATGTVDLRSESTVHKPIDQCLNMLDPRNWGRCSPHFDPEATYEIQTDGRGRPVRDRRGELIKATSTPLGTPWNGLMRERFDGEGISVENILQIRFRVDRSSSGAVTGADMRYSLYSCEYSQLGILRERGGLRKNSGSMTATPVPHKPTSTCVVVTKRVRYMDFTPGSPGRFFDLGGSLNVWAAVLLCARADSEAVFNLCCAA